MIFLEVTQKDITLAGVFMFAVMIAWLLAEFKGMKDELKERLGINNETIKLRLQAYERLTMFTERASLPALATRLVADCKTSMDLQLAMLDSLKSEYEYNISQQIYVSPELWKAVTKLRDQNSYIINQLAGTLPVDARAMDLARVVMDYDNTQNASLAKMVLDGIHFESKKLLK